MFFIPGQVIAAFTFPGVIVHEMGHQLMCRLCRVAVLDVCYFRFGNPAGYVLHEFPRKPAHSLLIGIAPFLFNTTVGALIALPAILPVSYLGESQVIDVVLIWLGVSIAMHSFPSVGDAEAIWQAVMAPTTGLGLRLVTLPIVGVIYLGALGSVFWLDAVYGVMVIYGLPKLLMLLLSG